MRGTTVHSPIRSPQRRRDNTNQVNSNLSPTPPTSASPIREPNHIPRRRTISSSSGSPCPPRVNIPSQMKLTSKVHKYPADNESSGIPPTSPKLQTRRQKHVKINPTPKCQKENGLLPFLENESSNDKSHHDVASKSIPKKETNKEIKFKYETQAPSAIKHQNRLKVSGVVTKSPSPPPLPPPNIFLSPHSSKKEDKQRDRLHKNFVEERRPWNTKGKQSLKPSQMALNKNPFGKENASSKVRVPPKSPIAKGNGSPNGNKRKIRLPYDNEFCCDDDKFHLLGLEGAKKDSVSIRLIHKPFLKNAIENFP